MKFGVFNLGMWHESQSQSEVFDSVQQQAILADTIGYDSFWVGEHHFSRHGIVADCLVQAASVAAVTERIRIGSAVVVLPFHHPVRLAEQIAMVDIMSRGRLDVGVGVGYQRREFAGLGVPIDEARERFRDNLQILLRCWADGVLEHDSEFHQHHVDDDIMVYPKPFQKPHPPIYQAVSITPASVEFAASNGIPVIVGGPTDVLGLAPQVIDLWRREMEAHGHDHTGVQIPCSKGIYVAETDDEAAADIAEVDEHWDLKLLQQIGSPISPAGELPKGYENWGNRISEHEKNALDRNRAGTPPLIGSPETVRERVLALRDMGVSYVFGQFGLPGMPQEKVHRSLELFGEIMPELQGSDGMPTRTATEAV